MTFGLYGCWHKIPPNLLHCSIDLTLDTMVTYVNIKVLLFCTAT
jgi:hypothetical protein